MDTRLVHAGTGRSFGLWDIRKIRKFFFVPVCSAYLYFKVACKYFFLVVAYFSVRVKGILRCDAKGFGVDPRIDFGWRLFNIMRS